MKRLFIACACAAMMCSCYTSRILVGDVQPKEPMIEVSKKHDAHFIGGLVKTAKEITEEHVGDAPNFAIHTKYGFGDMLLSFLTVGIYTPTTTKYYIPIRHMDNFTPVEKVKREPKPVKTHGFTLMLDGAVMTDFDYIGGVGSITLGYRINPHLLVGIGGRAGVAECRAYSYCSYYWHSGADTGEALYDNCLGSYEIYEGLLRFRYTMLNKRCSPYINIDGGFGTAHRADVMRTAEFYYYGTSPHDADDITTKSFMTWSVTPSFGCQFRLGGNVYFDIGVGYRMGKKLENTVESTYKDNYTSSGAKLTWKINPQAAVFSLGLSFTM